MARALEARTSLPAELASASAARRFVGSTLREWECDMLADSALLLVSELVTNAVLHARSRLDLVLSLAQNRLRVEVHDESQAQPTRKHYSAHAGTGRGLMLVDRLAALWGVEPIPGDGKRVWFELDRGDDGGGGLVDDDDVDLDALEAMLLGGSGEASGEPGRAGDTGEDGNGGGPAPRALLLATSAR